MNNQKDKVLVIGFIVASLYLSLTAMNTYGSSNEPNETSNFYFGSSPISSIKEQFSHTIGSNQSQLSSKPKNDLLHLDGISLENIKGWKSIDLGETFKAAAGRGIYLTIPTNLAIANKGLYTASVVVHNLNSESCKCKSLLDFLRWDNSRGHTTSTFVNGNQTVVDGNHSAWQMENSQLSGKKKELIVWTINNNLGYVFTYSFTDFGNQRYDKYLPEFRNMLDSIKFTEMSAPSPLLVQLDQKRNNTSLAYGNSQNNTQLEFDLENNFQVGTIELHPAIINSEIYKSATLQSHIFGEVLNNFTYPISVNKVYAAIRNTSGEIVITADGFIKERYLKPEQKSGFWILVQKDIPEHSNYSLVSTFENTSIIKPELLRIDVDIMSLNPIKVVGTVTNLGGERATDVHVNGIFYDSSHKVVDSEDDFINIYSGLDSGGKGAFELSPILNFENRDKIKSFALSAESSEYINSPNNLATTSLSK